MKWIEIEKKYNELPPIGWTKNGEIIYAETSNNVMEDYGVY